MQNNNVKSPNFENRNPTTFIHILPLNSTLWVVCGLRWRGNLASLQEVSIYSTYSQNSMDKWNVIFDRSFTERLKLAKSMIRILRYKTKCLLNIFFLSRRRHTHRNSRTSPSSPNLPFASCLTKGTAAAWIAIICIGQNSSLTIA